MTDNIFKEDDATKEMIQKISSLFGVKADIVRQVWQFTIFTLLLDNVENDGTRLSRFVLPYLGTIGVKNNGTFATAKGVEPDLDVFVNLSDQFKQLFAKTQNGNYGDLSNYVQKKFLEPVLDNISNQ